MQNILKSVLPTLFVYLSSLLISFTANCNKSIEYLLYRDACDVTVIIIGNGHGDPSSNPGQSCLHFT